MPDIRTRIAALAVAHEWSPDGTGEGQCECDARWFKTKEMWADHLADAVIRELALEQDCGCQPVFPTRTGEVTDE